MSDDKSASVGMQAYMQAGHPSIIGVILIRQSEVTYGLRHYGMAILRNYKRDALAADR